LTSGKIQLAALCAILYEEGSMVGVQDLPRFAIPLHAQVAAFDIRMQANLV